MRTNKGKTVRPVVGVAGLLVNGRGRILLVHNKGDRYWTIPTGTMEPRDVTTEAAVVREMPEELVGLRNLELITSLGTTPGNKDSPKGAHGWLIEIFLCRIKGRITGYLEGDKSTLVPVQRLTQRRLDSLAKTAIKRYLDRTGGKNEEGTMGAIKGISNSVEECSTC